MSTDFVIYYRDRQVPRPGIVVLGHVTGDVSIFDWPGSVTIRIERADWLACGIPVTRARHTAAAMVIRLRPVAFEA